MESPTPYLIRNDEDKHEKMEALEALQNLLELIREDVQYPSRVKVHLDRADKLVRTMRHEIWRKL